MLSLFSEKSELPTPRNSVGGWGGGRGGWIGGKLFPTDLPLTAAGSSLDVQSIPVDLVTGFLPTTSTSITLPYSIGS